MRGSERKRTLAAEIAGDGDGEVDVEDGQSAVGDAGAHVMVLATTYAAPVPAAVAASMSEKGCSCAGVMPASAAMTSAALATGAVTATGHVTVEARRRPAAAAPAAGCSARRVPLTAAGSTATLAAARPPGHVSETNGDSVARTHSASDAMHCSSPASDTPRPVGAAAATDTLSSSSGTGE